MGDKSKEYKKLRRQFLNDYILTITENVSIDSNFKTDILKKNIKFAPTLSQSFGRNKLNTTLDMKRIKNSAVNFITRILEEESTKGKNKQKEQAETEDLTDHKSQSTLFSNHITLKDVHTYAFFKNFTLVSVLTIGVPLILIMKWSSIKSMRLIKYLFLLPILYSTFYIRDMVNNYTTHKEAMFMLFVLEKNYKSNIKVYQEYSDFMKDNHLKFVKVDSNIDARNRKNTLNNANTTAELTNVDIKTKLSNDQIKV